MRVGILGSGLMGGKLGTIFARAGNEVVFSYARSKQKLEKLARGAKGKARAGTPDEAARGADVVLLAVHWSRMDDVLKQAGDLSGKVLISCSLPLMVDVGLAGGRHRSRTADCCTVDQQRDRCLAVSGVWWCNACGGATDRQTDPAG